MPEKANTYAPEKTIAHEPERSRYTLRLDGKVVGVADYVRDGDAFAITYTGVDPHLRGQGLAGELVDFALRDLQESELEVLP
ncbi:MAG TPA: GNAT family N-acetyltransferase, partial [Solirubrobacterales bacterium]|nr:GNAT family N-acetyltransferase [Solirubrobacterales bacterium]